MGIAQFEISVDGVQSFSVLPAYFHDLLRILMSNKLYEKVKEKCFEMSLLYRREKKRRRLCSKIEGLNSQYKLLL